MSTSDSPYLFTAVDYWAYLQKQNRAPTRSAPHTVILSLQGGQTLFNRWQKRIYHRQITGFTAQLTLLRHTGWQVALATGFGVGGPATAALIETLYVWGVQRFILIGVAAGLQATLDSSSIILPNHAIGPDTLFQHYHPSPISQNAHSPLLQAIQSTYPSAQQGSIWSTDAPFREKIVDIEQHTTAGVLAVDMETAALFAVGQTLGVETIAVLVISDLYTNGRWQPPNTIKPITQTVTQLHHDVIRLSAQHSITLSTTSC